jgi:hypothetical protein
MRSKKYKKGLKLNGLNQLFVYADDVDFVGDEIHALQSNTDTLVEACNVIEKKIYDNGPKCGGRMK